MRDILRFLDRYETRKNGRYGDLSAKFQISIPKAVREAQAWQAGQELVLIPKGKGVLIMPVPTRDELRGLAKGANPRGYRDRSDRV